MLKTSSQALFALNLMKPLQALATCLKIVNDWPVDRWLPRCTLHHSNRILVILEAEFFSLSWSIYTLAMIIFISTSADNVKVGATVPRGPLAIEHYINVYAVL